MGVKAEYGKKHLSALILGGTVVFGFLMLVGGAYLKTLSAADVGTHEYAVKVLIEICTQLGVALILLAATIFFFNLDDVRTTMSRGVVSLFAEGDVVRFFSNDTKDRLRQVLTLDRLAPAIGSIPDNLYKFLSEVEKEVMAKPVATGMRWIKTISKDKKEDVDLYKNELSISFCLSVDHLTDKTFTHTFRFAEEAIFSGKTPVTLHEWFERLEIKIGRDKYFLDSPDVVKTERTEGGRHIYALDFKKDVHISGEVEISLQAVYWKSNLSNLEVFKTRVPALDPYTSVTFPHGQVCGVLWLAAQPDVYSQASENHQAQSCHTTYRGWLLPKEGAVFYLLTK